MSALAPAGTITATLSVEPNTTSGSWSSGQFVTVTVYAASNGGPGHGFSGADYWNASNAFAIADANLVKFAAGTGPSAFYAYSNGPTMGDAIYKARIGAVGGSEKLDYGTTAPIALVNLQFQIQPAFTATPGKTVGVTFTGDLGVYDGDNSFDHDWAINLFGTGYASQHGSGTFNLTYLPEPTGGLLLLAGLGALLRRRRR